MNYCIALQTTYDGIDCAVYTLTQTTCGVVQRTAIHKADASAHLMPTISTMLATQQSSFDDVAYIAVNQGPGPFTTLRVLIATVNGIAFAKNTPLIGVDGLRAFIQEQTDPAYPATIALLNAFSNDVYIAHQNHTAPLHTCCQRIQDFLRSTQLDQPVRFIGNGAALHKEQILNCFGQHAIFPNPLPLFCSLDAIAQQAHAQWRAGNTVQQVQPLYLKGVSW